MVSLSVITLWVSKIPRSLLVGFESRLNIARVINKDVKNRLFCCYVRCKTLIKRKCHRQKQVNRKGEIGSPSYPWVLDLALFMKAKVTVNTIIEEQKKTLTNLESELCKCLVPIYKSNKKNHILRMIENHKLSSKCFLDWRTM